jgi:glyoxylase-like metal-dependent hydrolase (beta-lactamase superfamily II)
MDLIQRMGRMAAVAALGFMGVLGTAPLQAAAPMVRTQAPGYYRMMLGDFEVTALFDGEFAIPAKELLGILDDVSESQLEHALKRSFAREPFVLSINVFLINTGSKLVLVDTGEGAHMTPDSGRLIANLKAAGYEPAQVDEIYITHMHGDHIGGLSHNGERVFTNAVVRASREEADYWLKPENLASATAERRHDFQQAIDWLEPYVKAGRFRPFDGDITLVPGVKAVGTPGHTPGHTCYLVESHGSRLLLIGDLVHIEPVQFAIPEVTLKFDVDSNSARSERLRMFHEAAESREWVGAAHMPFPGLGHIRADGAGYDWVPASYSATH